MMMKSYEELVSEVASKVLSEIIYQEKKNFNTKEKKDSDMIKLVKETIEREVKKNDIQTNET